MSDLTRREKEVLDHLLSIDFAGCDALRDQLREARVKFREPGWIELLVTGEVRKAEVENVQPVEARVKGKDPPIEVLLFVRDGRLKNLELVTYGEPLPPQLPAVEELDAPSALGPIA